MKKAFSLIEMVIVIAIIAIMGVVAYLNLYTSSTKTSVTSAKNQIVALLHQAQSRSTSQANNFDWGVHFDNTNPIAPTYSLFSATSTDGVYSPATAMGTYRLPAGICYGNIIQGQSIDIVFAQISGYTSAPDNTVISLISCSSGGIASWAPATPLPQGTYWQPAVVYNGYIYSLGGGVPQLICCGLYQTISTSTVLYTKINSDGSLGNWMTANYALPTPVYEQPAVIYNGYIYSIGGWSTQLSNVVKTVVYNKINADGTLASNWIATADLPTGINDEAAVTYNGYLYLMGGFDETNFTETNAVLYAKINADGSLGSWLTALPLPAPIFSQAGAAYNGYLYSLGGNANGSATNVVNRAKISTDGSGSLGPWSATTPLADGVFGQALITYNNYFYSIGGFSSRGNVPDVSYSKISPDGTVASWSMTTPLPNGIYYQPAVFYNGYVYSIGGHANELNPTSTVWYGSLAGGLSASISVTPQGSITY